MISPGLRLAFLGTPDFAVPTLMALHAAGHDIACVYTQPPRPAGRGRLTQRSPVHNQADALGLPVRHPAILRRDEAAWAEFAALDLDAAIVAAYGLILPPAMLSAPRRGCLNVHASLLPRWRGAAPIQAAILAGDTETGVTIMQMDSGLDTGPMLLSGRVPITPITTAAMLHDDLATLGASLILQALAKPIEPKLQPAIGASCASKLRRDDGMLDWRQSAVVLDRIIRALNPWPGTTTTILGASLKILEARPEVVHGAAAAPGTLLDDDLLVACGQDALRLIRIQRPGRAVLTRADFLRGTKLAAGTIIG